MSKYSFVMQLVNVSKVLVNVSKVLVNVSKVFCLCLCFLGIVH